MVLRYLEFRLKRARPARWPRLCGERENGAYQCQRTVAARGTLV